MIAVDGTLGSAGHAYAILQRIIPQGRLIALDQDRAAIERGKEILKEFYQVTFICDNFRHLDKVLDTLNIYNVDAVILDVGLSSDQLEEEKRGFSFEGEGPLDMRMDSTADWTARDVVNDFPQEKLETLFRNSGEQRGARRFARAICYARQKRPIETTRDLAEIICRSLGVKHKEKDSGRTWQFRRHPATRVFQALRIAVNDELGALEEALPKIWQRMKPGGRVAVISFHSLEDRIVKHQFRSWQRSHEGIILTKKPVVASKDEIRDNPRARSAKLRVVERAHEGAR